MNEIGNYRILKKLGEGGMGEVFMGEDIMLERKVAIKILRPELSQREDILQRFRTEAVALGRLNHPNIATVYAFARDGDRYYLAMEFVNGEALDTVIKKRGRLAWQDAVRYACDALAGLEHAHRLNVIHRDIKPANMMLNFSGELKLMDFGIARILERSRQTRSGYLIGTLEYISPEQAQGLEVDARSDIYSMGAVLYEMLTGRLPFQKNTDYELLQAQIKELPQSPLTFAGDMPRALENIILKALEKEPEKRFSTALEFSKALSELLHGSTFGNVATPQTRLSNSLSDFAISEQNNQPARENETRKFQVIAFVNNYPIPVISAILLALAIPYFVMNSRINVLDNTTQETGIRLKDDIKPTVNKEPTDQKASIENKSIDSLSTSSPVTPKPEPLEYPSPPSPSIYAFPSSPSINEIKEDSSQRKTESHPPQQKTEDDVKEKAKQKAKKAENDVEEKARQKAKKDAQNKAEKERKRREAETLAKAKKEQSKRLAQQVEVKPQTPKKESSGWVIIPGKTQKTY